MSALSYCKNNTPTSSTEVVGAGVVVVLVRACGRRVRCASLSPIEPDEWLKCRRRTHVRAAMYTAVWNNVLRTQLVSSVEASYSDAVAKIRAPRQ